MLPIRTPPTAAILVLATLLTSACAPRLHRAAQYETAVRAQSAFDEAGLEDGLERERELMDELRDEELAVVRRHTLARRDAALQAVIAGTGYDDSWLRFDALVNERLIEFFGPDATDPQRADGAAARRLITLGAELEELASDVEAAAGLYNQIRGPSDPPASATCATRRGPGEDADAEVGLFWRNYLGDCEERAEALAEFGSIFRPGSVVGRLDAELQRVDSATRALRDAVAEAEAEYREARRRYEDVVRAEERSAQAIRDRAGQLRIELEEIASAFPSTDAATDALEENGLGDLTLVGLLRSIELKRAAIDSLLGASLDALADLDELLPEDARIEYELVSFLAGVEGELAELRPPRLGLLLLESERLALQEEDVRRRIDAASRRRALLEEKRVALIDEARWLARTRVALDGALSSDACPDDMAMGPAFREAGPDCARLVVEALVRYSNSWNMGRLQQEEVDYRLIALGHERVLDTSEIALAHWQNLVGIPLDRLVAWHESGIRPELIAQVVQAIGLAAIAVGVN